MRKTVKVVHAPTPTNGFTGNTLYTIEYALCLQDAGLDSEAVFIESSEAKAKAMLKVYEKIAERRYERRPKIRTTTPWYMTECDLALMTDRTIREFGGCVTASKVWALDTWCGRTDDKFKVKGSHEKRIYFEGMKRTKRPTNGKLFVPLNGLRMTTMSDVIRIIATMCIDEDVTELVTYVNPSALEENRWVSTLFDTVLTTPTENPVEEFEHICYVIQRNGRDIAPRLPYEAAWHGVKIHDPLDRMPPVVRMDVMSGMFGRVGLTTESKLIQEIKERC